MILAVSRVAKKDRDTKKERFSARIAERKNMIYWMS